MSRPASSVTAQLFIQLAKLVRLKIIAVANANKHKARLDALGAGEFCCKMSVSSPCSFFRGHRAYAARTTDIVIDKTDLLVASREIASLTKGSLRFALDVVGKETAEWCQEILQSCSTSPSGTPAMSHLVCLTGQPRRRSDSVKVHQVPIKLFHANPRLGSRLSKWLYCVLEAGALKPPETIFVDGGLNVIGACLDMLRRGEASGNRVVVRMDNHGRWPASASAEGVVP
jgi:hypothetical protein